MNNKKLGVPQVLLTVLGLAFLLGSVLVFHPCGPKEDGSWMNCHWAGVAVSLCAAAVTVLAAVRLFVPGRRVRQVLSGLTIPFSLAAAVIPGNVIHLCMMADMRCRALMRPAAIIFAVLCIAAAAWDIISLGRSGKR